MHFSHIPAQITSSINCVICPYKSVYVFIRRAAMSRLRLCFSCCRSNLKGLYRGDIYNVYNCQRNIRASRPALVCWMGYTSFTAAHICIGTSVKQMLAGGQYKVSVVVLNYSGSLAFSFLFFSWLQKCLEILDTACREYPDTGFIASADYSSCISMHLHRALSVHTS